MERNKVWVVGKDGLTDKERRSLGHYNEEVLELQAKWEHGWEPTEGEYDLPRVWNTNFEKTEAGGVLIPITRPTLNLLHPPPPRVCMNIHPEGASCGLVRPRFECLFATTLVRGRVLLAHQVQGG